MLPRSILCFLLLTLSVGPARPAADQTESLQPILYTVAKSYEPLAWMHGSDRFASGSVIILRDGKGQRPLVSDFAVSADPSVSFDGQRVLFAAKLKPQDPWQIWEVDLAGGKPRRVTNTNEDCIRPLYLPDENAVYACKKDGRFTVLSSSISGGKSLALTYGPANFLPTDVLRDGRILFGAGYPLGSDSTPELYTVYSDGSGVESYRCDHGTPRFSGRQAGSGDIVFTTSHGLARFTSAKAQQVTLSTPAGEYSGDVAETSTNDWLVSWRPDAHTRYRLMRWTPGSQNLQSLIDQPDADIFQPTLIAPRPTANRHPSGLHDWNNANLLCLNSYTSKYAFAPNAIHSVRMYTRDSSGNTKLLGTAPVEQDGSFFVHVPTEQPLQIELLDAAGKSLKREAGFFYMRRGEQRVCVGCHAGPETAPENAVPQILLKSTTPADMTGTSAQTASGGH